MNLVQCFFDAAKEINIAAIRHLSVLQFLRTTERKKQCLIRKMMLLEIRNGQMRLFMRARQAKLF